MKQKEMIQLGVAVVIIFVAGLLVYSQLRPRGAMAKKQAAMSYEVVTKIEPDYDTDALKMMKDTSKVYDFYTAPDLKNGLGNPQPFGPLQ